MSKIHLEVEIPGNAKTYEFMLDDRMKIGTAKKQIMKQIAELEGHDLFEGLDNMVILDASHVFSVPFGFQHLTALPAWFTALMGGEDLLLRLIAVEDVVDPDIQPTFSGQDLGDSHYGLATWYINS